MPKLFHFLRPRHALPLLLLLGSFTALHAQQIAVKTNGLMFAVSYTHLTLPTTERV